MAAPIRDKAHSEITRWLESVVIGQNLCPFAKHPYLNETVEIVISLEQDFEALIEVFATELERLEQYDAKVLETTLLVLPNATPLFEDYLEILALANEFVALKGWEGRYQIASFHPLYQFDGTDSDSRENYTNRAPYPVLHLLREESVSKAVDSHPDVDSIPERNIEWLNALSDDDFKRLFFPEK